MNTHPHFPCVFPRRRALHEESAGSRPKSRFLIAEAVRKDKRESSLEPAMVASCQSRECAEVCAERLVRRDVLDHQATNWSPTHVARIIHTHRSLVSCCFIAGGAKCTGNVGQLRCCVFTR